MAGGMCQYCPRPNPILSRPNAWPPESENTSPRWVTETDVCRGEEDSCAGGVIQSRSISTQNGRPVDDFGRASRQKRASRDSCRRYAERGCRWSAPASILRRHWPDPAFSVRCPRGSTAGSCSNHSRCGGLSDFDETATCPSVRRCPKRLRSLSSMSGVDLGPEWASARAAVTRIQPTLATSDIAQ
jgi:hypothetical protein